MPAMLDLTIKKADTTTDIVWTGVQSGGSKERPAIWQSATVGVAVSHRPELRYYVERLGGTKGNVVLTAQYPTIYTDSTTGVTSILKRQKVKAVYEIEQEMKQSDIDEFTHQINNLLFHATMKNAIRSLSVFT
jgi:hypothetical protein